MKSGPRSEGRARTIRQLAPRTRGPDPDLALKANVWGVRAEDRKKKRVIRSSVDIRDSDDG